MVHAVIAILALQQPVDSAYTVKIRELTTEPRFNTELTDHLPADPRVPTPLKVLGYVPGTVGHLSYVADITRYFRALDDAGELPDRPRDIAEHLERRGHSWGGGQIIDRKS